MLERDVEDDLCFGSLSPVYRWPRIVSKPRACFHPIGTSTSVPSSWVAALSFGCVRSHAREDRGIPEGYLDAGRFGGSSKAPPFA